MALKSGESGQAVKDAFLKFAGMTPAERIRDAVLKMMGITEESLEALPPEKREKIEEAIKEKLVELLKQKQERIVGALADVTV